MSTIDILKPSFEFNRARTIALLDAIEQLPDPVGVLAWRPGPGRAHIGWQLAHIAVTEEMFATERLASQRTAKHAELWHRFRGGSTPDENVPSLEALRSLLSSCRQSLLDTLTDYGDDRLQEIPEALKQRNWTVREVLSVLLWHEGHHQGQAHLTLNLYKASH